MPFSCIKCLTSSLVNGGPLSLRTTLGIPCVENIRPNFGIMALAEVEWTISTSGKREYASMATNKMEMGRRNPHEPYAKALVATETSGVDLVDSRVH